jgi:hypothetical protein
VNAKLTLNFGVRYEYETGIFSPNERSAPGFDRKAINPIQAQVPGIARPGVFKYAGQNGYGTAAMNPNRDKFGPRFGFAYPVTPKTTCAAVPAVLAFVLAAIDLRLQGHDKLCVVE